MPEPCIQVEKINNVKTDVMLLTQKLTDYCDKNQEMLNLHEKRLTTIEQDAKKTIIQVAGLASSIGVLIPLVLKMVGML